MTTRGTTRVTLRDVAARAQVHYATASTVLNGAKGSTRVSEETSKRVMQAAADLGYRVNRTAQQLRTQRSQIVGLLTGDLENPFFSRMVALCSADLERAGYEVILASRRLDSTHDFHLLESLLSRELAGVLIWSETMTEVRERVQKSGIGNVVVLGLTIPGFDSAAGVLETGLAEALDHLRAQGYQRIAYFAPEQMIGREGDPRDRVYRAKMAAFGQAERVLSYRGSASDVAAARAAAEALAGKWTQMPPEERPDALLCFNDMNAFGAMMGLRRRGLRIPEDIALVGCDDLPLAAQLDVPLTTIHYPLEAICGAAVQQLLGRIGTPNPPEMPPAPPQAALWETHLVVRESSLRHGSQPPP